MRYSDSVEKSAEYLRQALPLMSQQAAGLHPVSYAVWYEYVSGINPSLTASIDELLKNRRVLDEQMTTELFRKHVTELNEEQARRMTAEFQQIMVDMAHSATVAGDQANRFGSALEQWSERQIDTSPSADAGVGMLFEHTRVIQSSITSLKARLDESRNEIEQLRQEVSKARKDALADALTGLTNRRGFDIALATCLSGMEQQGPSLLMTDIDFFKRVNDTYGHLFGDKVLCAIAQILRNNVKGKDVAARYGGEEFIVLLPETPLEGARHLAETIRATVEKCRIKRNGSNEIVANITVSLGVASYRRDESANDFIARVDSALYASKNQGRNRATIADASVPA